MTHIVNRYVAAVHGALMECFQVQGVVVFSVDDVEREETTRLFER